MTRDSPLTHGPSRQVVTRPPRKRGVGSPNLREEEMGGLGAGTEWLERSRQRAEHVHWPHARPAHGSRVRVARLRPHARWQPRRLPRRDARVRLGPREPATGSPDRARMVRPRCRGRPRRGRRAREPRVRRPRRRREQLAALGPAARPASAARRETGRAWCEPRGRRVQRLGFRAPVAAVVAVVVVFVVAVLVSVRAVPNEALSPPRRRSARRGAGGSSVARAGRRRLTGPDVAPRGRLATRSGPGRATGAGPRGSTSQRGSRREAGG